MKKTTSISMLMLGLCVSVLSALGATQALAQATTGTADLATTATAKAIADTAAAPATTATAPSAMPTATDLATTAATPTTASATADPTTSTRVARIPVMPNIPPLVPQSNEKGLRFNFRGAPIDRVLDYMSVAAGFIIIREAEVSGNVDVVSHQPLNNGEAVLLLNTILHQKGFTAIRNERTLTIVKRDEARTRDLPIRMGSDPTSIPKTDEMVTQIMPVRHADVNQLMQNIDELLPDYATISVNESSNAIIITDTQTNIRRVATIIQALDTSISQVATVRIFRIKRGEATEIALIINQIVGNSGSGGGSSGRSSSDDDRRQRMMEFMSRMRGGGGPGGGRGR